jgi:hypothetical protein
VWILKWKVPYCCRKLNPVSFTEVFEANLISHRPLQVMHHAKISKRIGDNQEPEWASQQATGWAREVQFPADIRDLRLIRNVQNGSGAHVVSWASFPRG